MVEILVVRDFSQSGRAFSLIREVPCHTPWHHSELVNFSVRKCLMYSYFLIVSYHVISFVRIRRPVDESPCFLHTIDEQIETETTEIEREICIIKHRNRLIWPTRKTTFPLLPYCRMNSSKAIKRSSLGTSIFHNPSVGLSSFVSIRPCPSAKQQWVLLQVLY